MEYGPVLGQCLHSQPAAKVLQYRPVREAVARLVRLKNYLNNRNEIDQGGKRGMMVKGQIIPTHYGSPQCLTESPWE